MAHVEDVKRSIAFYRQMGFEDVNTLERDGQLQWAWVRNGKAHLMLARSARPMNAEAQDVLFYLYAADVAEYREQLAGRGVAVSSLRYPEYMPAGEFRIDDPDGYCLLVGQWDEESL
jgi:predicted lactoylglutathione lyase